MSRYLCFCGPEWVCDVLAYSEAEAMEKARQINPLVDCIEMVSEGAA